MDLHICTYFTICLGKATDTISSACLAIIFWFVNDNEVLEELYKLNAYIVMITVSHIRCAAINTSSEPQVRYLKIVSLSTDGILSVTGKEAGLITLLMKHNSPDTVPFHCLAHHEALCAKYCDLSHKGINGSGQHHCFMYSIQKTI